MSYRLCCLIEFVVLRNKPHRRPTDSLADAIRDSMIPDEIPVLGQSHVETIEHDLSRCPHVELDSNCQSLSHLSDHLRGQRLRRRNPNIAACPSYDFFSEPITKGF